MSTRLSFFEVPSLIDLGLEPFIKGVESERFNSRAAAGFLVDRRSSRSLEGRYVQRVSGDTTFVDPLGKKHKQETLYYIEQRFILRTTLPQLIVLNANTSLRSLTGRFSEYSDFRIAVKAVEWSPEDVILALAERVSALRVYAAKVGDIRLSAAVEARIICEGSSPDVRREVRDFLRNRVVSFESLKVEFEHAGKLRRCEIRAGGSIQAYGEEDSTLTELLIKLATALRFRVVS